MWRQRRRSDPTAPLPTQKLAGVAALKRATALHWGKKGGKMVDKRGASTVSVARLSLGFGKFTVGSASNFTHVAN